MSKGSTFNESQELTEAISWQAIVPGIGIRYVTSWRQREP